MKVSIIGQGYVGLTIAKFASVYHEVIGFDNSSDVVKNLNAGISHIEGIDSIELMSAINRGAYKASTHPKDIADSDIVIIAVPTPLTHDRKPDLSYIDSACRTIGENLTRSSLIINESTSFPGTIRNYIKPMIEKYSKNTFEHGYAISPERVDPGRSGWNQKNTPRLFAGLTKVASEKTRDFYSSFCDNLIEVSSPEVAEAAKLFENTFRQVNIALVNEFAKISHALGISVHETLDAANSKPYGFMKFNPSAGVGGHCIPVDPTYLSHIAQNLGIRANFIDLANEVNLSMPSYVVSRVKQDNNNNLVNKKVQVVGVAYKPDVADVRETPAKQVIDEFRREGAIVTWHDPIVKEWNEESSSPLGGADITVVITLHSSISKDVIAKSAQYVFDSTGSIQSAKWL